MPEIFDLYAHYLRAAGASDRTVTARAHGARRMMRLSAVDDPHQLVAAHALVYIGSVAARASRATYCQHVRAFDRFLTAIGSPAAGFSSTVPVARFPRGIPRPVDVNELSAALASAQVHERTMLMLAAYAGLRVSEIAAVRGEDVSDHGLFVRGKGGVDKMIPLHRVLSEVAGDYPSSGYWFPGRFAGCLERTAVWKMMRRALLRVGSSATPHQVRHYYGTTLLDTGANLRVVQELMRHASVSSTQIYTRVRAEDCRAAIAALPELGRSA